MGEQRLRAVNSSLRLQLALEQENIQFTPEQVAEAAVPETQSTKECVTIGCCRQAHPLWDGLHCTQLCRDWHRLHSSAVAALLASSAPVPSEAFAPGDIVSWSELWPDSPRRVYAGYVIRIGRDLYAGQVRVRYPSEDPSAWSSGRWIHAKAT